MQARKCREREQEYALGPNWFSTIFLKKRIYVFSPFYKNRNKICISEWGACTLYKNLATYPEVIFPLMSKIAMAKDGKRNVIFFCSLQMWTKFAISGANSIKSNLWTCNLQIGRPKISYKTVKQFPFNLPYPNGKNIHICKWISFAISNFVIIEKMASGCLVILWLKSKIGLISYYLYKMIKFAPFLT